MSELLQQANEEQKKVITHGDGPLLVVAGAGTGKTRAITSRIAWLIEQEKAKPDEILALTFTDKAANEMEERVDQLLPLGYYTLWISTFHSFADKVLRAHGLDIGLPTDYKLLNQTEQWMLVRQNLDKFNLDYYKPMNNPTKFIHALLKHFSRCKDELIWPKNYLQYAEDLKLDTESKYFVKKLKLEELPEQDRKDFFKKEILRVNEVADAYHVYQQLLLENNALDFGDLINYLFQLFKERPNVLQYYRNQFKYILIDEFQDTNHAQYEMIKLLAAPKNNLAVVGDDDQCLPGSTKIVLPNGKSKRISQIQAGEQILTAVGKGHVSVSKVNHVEKNFKKGQFVKIKTKSGQILEMTNNHKVFCHTLGIHKTAKWYYIYLMHRQGLGWRMGITNNLKTRLKLERSSDSILAVRAYKTESEARYWEIVYSLKYGIPTVCFQERKGINIKRDLLFKLYKDLDVQKHVERLATDLNIDLEHPHYSLDAVICGGKKRFKILLELCVRKYRSKGAQKRVFLKTPLVHHSLSIETSDMKTVDLLRKNGFNFRQAKKKGFKFEKVSLDIVELGQLARKIQQLTGGIIEYRSKIGRLNYQHLPALIIPAKNLVEGNYVPVRKGSQIVYDEIIEVQRYSKNCYVYDLEIDRTHNFIANGVVVHNSVYKFRGASVSNILRFKKDFIDATDVVLTKNYRTVQAILDKAYEFIQQNNPDRLEDKMQISKKLVSQVGADCDVKHFHGQTLDDEARFVVDKIAQIKKQNPETAWSDFAILVRANDSAEIFNNYLDQEKISYQFVALKGLYQKPLILDLINYFRLLDNYHESSAVYRVLSAPFLNLTQEDIVNLNYFAKKKALSLFQALKQARTVPGLSEQAIAEVEKLLSLIEKHSWLAKHKPVSEVLLGFLYDSGYLQLLKDLPDPKNQEQLGYLQQFWEKIKRFEENSADKKIAGFMYLLEMELEAGESGGLVADLETGPDTVKVMTVHSAKGLEFEHVFIVNLVDQRFPTNQRKEPIEIPDKLIKDILPEGDFHLQEERRLFYVAMTRAKKGLYFCSAENYGGARKKKISRFLQELGEVDLATEGTVADNVPRLRPADSARDDMARSRSLERSALYKPKYLSFSQLNKFSQCPLMYKYAYVLKIVPFGKPALSFGNSIHLTLQTFLEEYLHTFVIPTGTEGSKDLFGNTVTAEKTSLSKGRVLEIFQQKWIDEWYVDEKQKQAYFEKGKKILEKFYDNFIEQKPEVLHLEQMFKLPFKDYIIVGKIDRIDKMGDGVEVIDYKTGSVKDKLKPEDRKQLLLYQIAVEECFKLKPKKLSYYYLEADREPRLDFVGKDEDKLKFKEDLAEAVSKIEKSDFVAAAGFWCQFCDYKNICEHKKK